MNTESMDQSEGCIKLIYEDKAYDIQVCWDFTGEILMTQIMSIVNVPMERMTILGLPNNGYLLKDQTLSSQGIRDGIALLLIAPKILKGVKGSEQKRFFQDDKSVYDMIHLAGIQNIENTCYFNSVIQFLANIPELITSVATYPKRKLEVEGPQEEMMDPPLEGDPERPAPIEIPMGGINNNIGNNARQNEGGAGVGGEGMEGNIQQPPFIINQLVIELGRFMKKLVSNDDTDSPLYPSALLDAFRNEFPVFATKDDSGNFIQQDAEEGLVSLLTTLRNELLGGRCDLYTKKDESPGNIIGRKADYINSRYNNTVSRLMQCVMAPPASTDFSRHESFVDEDCLLIPIRVTSKTNSLEETLFFSQGEGKPKFLLEYAPTYLLVHFMRFNVMKNKNKRERVNPFESVIPKRQTISEVNEDEEKFKTDGEKIEKMLDDEEDELATADVIIQKIRRRVTYPLSFSVDRIVDCPKPEDGAKPPDDNRKYELTSLVTHIGPSVSSGHYVCFSKSRVDLLKKKINPEALEGSGPVEEINGTPISKIWFCYDDDDVQDVSEEYVSGLSGGGEGDTAILLLYKLVE